MQRTILPSGLTILYDHQPSQSVTLFAQVNVGSNNEPRNVIGISHFLEHMIFEGTKKRKNSVTIANEIEKWGGEFNAFTQNDRTCFYIKVLKDYFHVALDIMGDIIQNSTFPQKFIDKERKVIFKEIDMVNDDPRMYNWILSGQITFPGHVAGIPIHGSKESMQKMTRADIVKFYEEYYVPSNMTLTIVGNVPQALRRVKKAFTRFQRKKIIPLQFPALHPLTANVTETHRRKISSAYCIWTWHAYSHVDKRSFALELINAILGRGQSGTLINALRNKHALAYEVGTTYDNFKDYGYFSINAGVPKSKFKTAEKAVFYELKKLSGITQKQLEEAKNYFIGKYLVDSEDTLERADIISFFEQCSEAKHADEYVKRIRKVSLSDVKSAAEEVFGKHHSLAIVSR